MQLTAEHKLHVEQQLVETVIGALEKNLMTVEEEGELSAFILERMPQVATQEELLSFLRELSAKSTVFSPLLVIESGEVKEHTEDSIAEKVESLTEEGKIDEAIRLAQTMTQSGGTT